MLHRRITLVSSLVLGMTLLTAQPILAEEPPVNQAVTSQVQSTSQLALDQIRQGNYASLAGRWVNAQGTVFLISPDGKIYTPDPLLEVHIELAGLSATSTDKQLSILTKVMPDNQVIGSLVVAPAGQAFLDMEDLDLTDPTDQTRDRLLLGPTARTVPYSQLVLYREGGDLVHNGKTLDQLLEEARTVADRVEMTGEEATSVGDSTTSSETVTASSLEASGTGTAVSNSSTEVSQGDQETEKEVNQVQEDTSSSSTVGTDQATVSPSVAAEESSTEQGQTVTESNSTSSPASSVAQPSSSTTSSSPSAQPSQSVNGQPSGSGQQSSGATSSPAQSSKAPATSPSSSKTVKSPAPTKTSNSAPVSGQSSTKASPLPAATKGVSQSSARPQAKGAHVSKKVLPKTGEASHWSGLRLGLGLFALGLLGPVLAFLGLGRRRQG